MFFDIHSQHSVCDPIRSQDKPRTPSASCKLPWDTPISLPSRFIQKSPTLSCFVPRLRTLWPRRARDSFQGPSNREPSISVVPDPKEISTVSLAVSPGGMVPMSTGSFTVVWPSSASCTVPRQRSSVLLVISTIISTVFLAPPLARRSSSSPPHSPSSCPRSIRVDEETNGGPFFGTSM